MANAKWLIQVAFSSWSWSGVAPTPSEIGGAEREQGQHQRDRRGEQRDRADPAALLGGAFGEEDDDERGDGGGADHRAEQDRGQVEAVVAVRRRRGRASCGGRGTAVGGPAAAPAPVTAARCWRARSPLRRDRRRRAGISGWNAAARRGACCTAAAADHSACSAVLTGCSPGNGR